MNRYEVRLRSKACSDTRSMIEVVAESHNDAKCKAEASHTDWIVIYVNLIAVPVAS